MRVRWTAAFGGLAIVVLGACSGGTAEPASGQTEANLGAQYCGGVLPDPAHTPGKLCTASDPNFDGYRYAEHVAHCARNVSSAKKDAVAAYYGIPKSEYANYEFDHYIPLAIGGSDDVENVWPQPKASALDKDVVENDAYLGMQRAALTQEQAVAMIRAWRPTPLPSGCGGSAADAGVADASARDAATGGGPGAIRTVFVIVMENHNWSAIKGSASAPYINGTLLPQGSHAENYTNLPGLHPSEPNYLWLEAGDNFGVTNDGTPAANHQATTNHLVTQLEHAGISWKTYQEDISGTVCPLTKTGKYAPKHNPFVYFDDVTGSTCTAHVRPYTELAGDLASDTVPRYVFITPNLCHDMHDSTGCATTDSLANGDMWLSTEVPKILASQAYRRGGALFITWDESEGGDFPIGMIVLSPFAKGQGYAGTLGYSHSSMLRTVQTIFGVGPLLGGARTARDLGDLFATFP